MEEAAQYNVFTEQHPFCCGPSCTSIGSMSCQEETCSSCKDWRNASNAPGMSFQEETCISCKDCNASSANSTPFVSAPSSPKRGTPRFGYYSARPAMLTISPSTEAHDVVEYDAVSAYAETESMSPSSPSLISEFEFSLRLSEAADQWFNPSGVAPAMSTADELFHNGKIRPLNTRVCPSSSYSICFTDPRIQYDDGYHAPHFHDACQPYTDGPSSAHAEHPQQQHPLMRKQRLGHIKPTSALSALEQWKKSMGRYDNGYSRQAHGHRVERAMQISSLPLAHYRNSRREVGHHQRAKSLSPLRVFHMDDKMQGRASFESTEMHGNTKTSHAVELGTIMRPRRSRKSWTLKELLNMGDNRVHDKRPQLQGNGMECGKLRSRNADLERTEEINVSSKDHVGHRSFVEERLQGKSSSHSDQGARSPWNLQQAGEEEHADGYYGMGSESIQVEEMKKKTFLPYKKGVLGCLGFTSKLNSIKNLQSCML